MSNIEPKQQKGFEQSILPSENSSLGNQIPSINSSLALMTTFTSDFSNFMINCAKATNPAILNMILKKRKKIEKENARMKQILETLLSQPLGKSLIQAGPQEFIVEKNAFSTQIGPELDWTVFSTLTLESRKFDLGSKTKDKELIAKGISSKGRNPDNAIFRAASAIAELKIKQENNFLQSLKRLLELIIALGKQKNSTIAQMILKEVKNLIKQKLKEQEKIRRLLDDIEKKLKIKDKDLTLKARNAMQSLLHAMKQEEHLFQNYLTHPNLTNLNTLLTYLTTKLSNNIKAIESTSKKITNLHPTINNTSAAIHELKDYNVDDVAKALDIDNTQFRKGIENLSKIIVDAYIGLDEAITGAIKKLDTVTGKDDFSKINNGGLAITKKCREDISKKPEFHQTLMDMILLMIDAFRALFGNNIEAVIQVVMMLSGDCGTQWDEIVKLNNPRLIGKANTGLIYDF